MPSFNHRFKYKKPSKESQREKAVVWKTFLTQKTGSFINSVAGWLLYAFLAPLVFFVFNRLLAKLIVIHCEWG